MTTTNTIDKNAANAEDVGATDTPAGGDVTTDAQVDEDAQVDDDADDDADEGDEKGRGKASRDAARYRTQLRAVEAERDALTARVEALQRAQVEALAATGLSVAGDLFDVGRVDVASLLDEDGAVDPERVREAVSAVVKARPGLAAGRRFPAPDPSQGSRGDGDTGKSWSGFLSGGRS